MKIRTLRGEERGGIAHVQEWTQSEAFWNGMKRAGRLAGMLLLLPIPFAVIEPFLFLIWGGVYYGILILIVGPFLHWKFSLERQTFSKVEGPCPKCEVVGVLTPSISPKLEFPLRVHCSHCGQFGSVFSE